jgi:hypothetical protein
MPMTLVDDTLRNLTLPMGSVLYPATPFEKSGNVAAFCSGCR